MQQPVKDAEQTLEAFGIVGIAEAYSKQQTDFGGAGSAVIVLTLWACNSLAFLPMRTFFILGSSPVILLYNDSPLICL